VGEYSGVLRDAIHQFKYNGHRMLAADLAGLMYKYLTTRSDFNSKGVDLIVAVPIHPVKKRLRGYNQSELLANELSRLTGIPASSRTVERFRQTRAQVELSREERLRNVSGAFKVASPEQLAGKKLLLIDDVSTTCSTVHECSLALRSGGASRVQVLCLAFGS
jgi:ComF family protein